MEVSGGPQCGRLQFTREGHRGKPANPETRAVMTKTRGLIVIVVLLVGAIAYDVVKSHLGETVPIAEAEKLLTEQQEAWNRGDLTEFLKSYDMSEEITFYSDDKVSRGWVSLN